MYCSSDSASLTTRSELGGKRLELLKEAVPKLARVAVLYDPGNQNSIFEVKRVFVALNKERPDGLYVLPGPLIFANVERVAAFALKSRLPSMYYYREAIEAGGLMYYGADLADSYRRVAYYVDKILKRAKPADLPVEQPTKFDLAINLKTAKQIGLTIPQSVLYRADKVIR